VTPFDQDDDLQPDPAGSVPDPAGSGSDAPNPWSGGSAARSPIPAPPDAPVGPALSAPAPVEITDPTPIVARPARSPDRASRPGSARPGSARPGSAHRGAESRVYNDIPHRVLKPSVRAVLNNVVMRIRLEGLDNVPRDEPLIFAGNHSSWLDGPLVVIESPRTVRCLTKSEMYHNRIVSRLLLISGQIPIDRSRADRVALHTALDELSRGGTIGVFPEGTRGQGDMASVQHGIAYLAIHGRCRVLPVACINTGKALPKGARWPKRSARVRVVFGKPFEVEIPANPRSRKALAAAAEDIRVRLAAHLDQARDD
jgi:1-acyl-sn-glycerol-3-phosphate acyltransferase